MPDKQTVVHTFPSDGELLLPEKCDVLFGSFAGFGFFSVLLTEEDVAGFFFTGSCRVTLQDYIKTSTGYPPNSS